MIKKVLIIDGSRDFSFNMSRSLVVCADCELHVLVWASEKKYSKLTHAVIHRIENYTDTERWIESIESIVNENNIDLIIAGEDKTIDFLIDYQENFTASVKLPVLPSRKSFDIANNKARLYEFISDNNLSQPLTLLYRKGADLTELSSLNYPVLLKPATGVGGKGIVKFTDEVTLKEHLLNNHFDEDILCQEYIVGRDICISVTCKSGDIVAYTMQQSLIEDPVAYASSLSQEFLYNKNGYNEASKLLKLLNWQGVAHIDMRINELTGQVYVIEINTRFWGSLMSSLAAGVNFTQIYCQQMLNLPVVYKGYNHIQFMRLKTLFECMLGKHKLLSPFRLLSLRTGFSFRFYRLRRWLSVQN